MAAVCLLGIALLMAAMLALAFILGSQATAAVATVAWLLAAPRARPPALRSPLEEDA